MRRSSLGTLEPLMEEMGRLGSMRDTKNEYSMPGSAALCYSNKLQFKCADNLNVNGCIAHLAIKS
eukprot:scaffold295865_cov14-Tisochrysis_lutea.AAC.1